MHKVSIRPTLTLSHGLRICKILYVNSLFLSNIYLDVICGYCLDLHSTIIIFCSLSSLPSSVSFINSISLLLLDLSLLSLNVL